MPLSLQDLRENLDGLGYYLGPRGLDGLGNNFSACDLDILGNIDCSSTAVRGLSFLDAYTEAAIYQFQQDNALATNGQDSADLRSRVEKAVRIVQNNLKIAVGIQLPLTGNYRRQTYNAVKVYQRNRRFPVTGIATIAVRRQLDADARGIQIPNPTPSPTPSDSELESLRKFRNDLSQLKGRLFRREITESEFTRLVYDIIP
jgi:peptidoglycan hydrolase-like protein with peptidoglycan-binding domain